MHILVRTLVLALPLSFAPQALEAQQENPPAAQYSAERAPEGLSLREQLEWLRQKDYREWLRFPALAPIPRAQVTSNYGSGRKHPVTGVRRDHFGTDIRARHGTPIRAAGEGTVVGATRTPTYGWAVDIDHGNGFVTRYAHASRLLVQKGQVVRRGQRIALVGATGLAKGPHLHFEIFRDGWSVNPADYMVYDSSEDPAR